MPDPDYAALEAALARELLLLVHHHADADSVGSAIALAAAFPGARISATDGLSAAGRVMAERLEVEIEERPHFHLLCRTNGHADPHVPLIHL